MKPTLTRIALILLLATVSGRAQDEPNPEPAPDADLLLSTALRRLALADAILADVDVKHEPAEVQAAGPGGMGVVVIQRTVGGELPPFEGKVEAWRGADGTTVLASAAELPGFALCRMDGRTVERTTVEEERFSLDQLGTELTALLDTGAFARYVLDAKLEHTIDAETGGVTFRGEISRDVVPPTIGDVPMMQSRVLATHVTLSVTPDGRLSRAEVKVTRNDPAREFMRHGRRMVVMGGGGGAVPMPAEDEDDKKHDIIGGYTTYALVFREGEPSARAMAFKEEVKRLLAAGSGR